MSSSLLLLSMALMLWQDRGRKDTAAAGLGWAPQIPQTPQTLQTPEGTCPLVLWDDTVPVFSRRSQEQPSHDCLFTEQGDPQQRAGNALQVWDRYLRHVGGVDEADDVAEQGSAIAEHEVQPQESHGACGGQGTLWCLLSPGCPERDSHPRAV